MKPATSSAEHQARLHTEWKSTRHLQTRLSIINNAYCPDELIHQALFSLDPDKVLDLPNISVKALWGEDFFIQACLALREQARTGGEPTERPLGYHYYQGSVHNKLLLYLETLYTKSKARQLHCLSGLNNKMYIKKLFKLKPELISLIETNSYLSYNLAFHLYSKDIIPYEQLADHCIDFGPVEAEDLDYANDYFPEFSITATNSIKKLCSDKSLNSKFPSLAFHRLFEVFISGSTTFYINRMRSSFNEEICKYKPEWQNKFCREIRGFFGEQVGKPAG